MKKEISPLSPHSEIKTLKSLVATLTTSYTICGYL